jgi:hypothetical protein
VRKRFRIVGKEFSIAALSQAIESLDTPKSPSNLLPELRTLFEQIDDCVDLSGRFCPDKKAKDYCYSWRGWAHVLP